MDSKKEISNLSIEWKKYPENKPEKNDVYLVHIKYLNVTIISLYTEKDYKSGAPKEFHTNGVTHWMELPEAPVMMN